MKMYLVVQVIFKSYFKLQVINHPNPQRAFGLEQNDYKHHSQTVVKPHFNAGV